MTVMRKKSTFSPGRAVLALILVALLSIAVSAQPDVEQKRAEGKAAFDEAIKLRQENTFRSYRSALEKFELSVRLYREIGDKGNAGSSLLGVGLIQNLLFEYDSALASYQQALAIFREIGHKELEARALNNIGRLYDEIGEKQKALDYHFQALPLRLITGDKYGEANSLNSIGSVYADLGERRKALEHFERALKIQTETDDKRAQAITLSNMGRLYDELGEADRALGLLERSLELRRTVGDKNGEATSLNNIGMVLAGKGDYAAAIERYQRSLALMTDLGFENRKAGILNNLGDAYIGSGDPARAIPYNRQALPLYQAMGDKAGEATTLNNIGYANARVNGPAAGLDDLQTALVLARSVRARGLEATVLGNLMRTSYQAGRAPVAVIFGKQCVDTYQGLRREIVGLDARQQRTYLDKIAGEYRFLADILIEMGRFAEAERILQMLKEEEYAGFVRRDADEIKTLDKRAILTEREQLLIERYSKLAGRAAEIGEQFRKLDDRKRRLSRLDQKLAPAEELQYQQLAAQVADVNAAFKLFLDKELTKELGTPAVRKINVDRSLQDELRKWGSGTVAVSTVVTENRYRVILTTPNVQVDGRTEITAAALNRKVFAFREQLQNADSNPLAAAKEIYDIIVKPIEKDLAAAGAKTVLWSLDGTLRYIPIAALSPDGRTYLVERFRNVIVTPKTRMNISASTETWRALGMGVAAEQMVTYPERPDRKVRVAALPGVKAELSAVIRDERYPNETGIITGRRYLDNDFTFRSFADSLSQERPDGGPKFNIIHLATHFTLGETWTNSYLSLGNSQLLSLEDLASSPEISFGGADLVTLSACNTALANDSNGQEVDSLAEAIQTKSGKAVLATLWAVYDESTAELMTRFYRELQQDPSMTKAEALNKAQRAMLGDAGAGGKRQFAHPYYWSGFVLIGNWR